MIIEPHYNPPTNLFYSAHNPLVASLQPATADNEAPFRELEEAAYAQGRIVAAAEGKLDAEWEILLAMLEEVWSHKSERGSRHIKGRGKRQRGRLSKWESWLRDFAKDNGLSTRSVRRNLQAYRERLSGARPQKAAAPAKAPNQKDKAVVPADANEHVPVSDGEPDAPQAAECSLRVTAPIAKFERQPSAGSTDFFCDEATHEDDELDWPPVSAEDQSLPTLKPGDRSGLADYAINKCGRAISTVLAGLTPNDQISVIDHVVKRLIQNFCATSRGDGQIEISVNYLPPPPPHLRKDWDCHIQL
jgi:hypothetical protein